MKKYTVGDILKEKNIILKLQSLTGKKGLKREIKTCEIHRPVLAFLGHYDSFPRGAVQVLGEEEMTALNIMRKNKKYELNRKMFSKDIPCFVVTADFNLPKYFIRKAEIAKMPVLRTKLSATRFIDRIFVFLDDGMAPKITAQGVMMDVYGMGVLITGESGIGKSECALELLKRGHRLIADDIVGIKQRSGSILVAHAMMTRHHYVEVRGLGIIDIEDVFGIGSVRNAIRVELVVRLEEWDKVKDYDRLGIEKRHTTILGIEITEVVVPVTAGRNLAVIIELAAKNQRLKAEGHYAAKELERELIKITKKKKKE